MADARKRKSSHDDAPGAGICNDVLDNIFARLPTRTAVASMVLSKHHQRLICSSDFRNLHFRLSPPLPNPHIAYISKFHGFHIACAGQSSDAPMRTLDGERYQEMKYINTCNGVVLFARECETKPPTCVLWNPAVGDIHKEVTVPTYWATRGDYRPRRFNNDPSDYSVLGFGYGKRSNDYKLLVSFRQRMDTILMSYPPQQTYSKELLIYTFGTSMNEPRRVTLLTSEGTPSNRSQESVYIDGVIYVLYSKSKVLACDIDSEKVTRIKVPGSSSYPYKNPVTSKLMQIYGRPCLVKNDDGHRALWLLTPDHQWERKCVFRVDDDLILCPINGVWEHNDVIALYLHNKRDDSKLLLYQVTTGKMLMKNLPHDLTPKRSHYTLCWGYRPTLLSPGSVLSGLNKDGKRRRNRKVRIMEALKPFDDQDKSTLDTVSFMEYLVRFIKKLPKNMQDLIEMSSFNS